MGKVDSFEWLLGKGFLLSNYTRHSGFNQMF